MYSREIAGQVLEFGVSGKLIMNVLVMYDRQTNSLWSQLLGRAVEGSLVGKELEFLPSWQTTWQDWKTRHPDTKVLVKGYRGLRDPYLSYYASGQAGVIGETIRDNRLNTKEFVIGVALGDLAVVYPFRTLNDQPLINDMIGDQPVLIVFDAENANGVVFDREVDGQILNFEAVGGLQIRDDQSASIWNGLTGAGISGDYAGAQLKRLKSTTVFWFGWKDFYPESRVFGQES